MIYVERKFLYMSSFFSDSCNRCKAGWKDDDAKTFSGGAEPYLCFHG